MFLAVEYLNPRMLAAIFTFMMYQNTYLIKSSLYVCVYTRYSPLLTLTILIFIICPISIIYVTNLNLKWNLLSWQKALKILTRFISKPDIGWFSKWSNKPREISDELSWKMPQTTKSAHKPRMSHNTLKWHPSSTNTSPKLSKSILRKSKHLDIPEPPKSAVPMARAKFTSRRSEYKHKVASMPSRMMIVMPDA